MQRYWHLGGFPETLFLDENHHSNLIQGYMNAVIFRDVVDVIKLKTRTREIEALIEANQILNAHSLYIITLDEAEVLTIEGGEIICVPFWEWANV